MRRTTVAIVSSLVSGGSGFYFSANPTNAPNFDTDFGSLYSVFKPIRTTFRWIPAMNTNEVASGDAVWLVPTYSVIDPSITTAPTAESDLLQCGGLAVKPINQPWTRSCVPSLAVALSNGYALPPSSNFWTAIGSDPQMNGLRMFVPDMGQTAITYIGRMMITYEFLLSGTN